MNLSRISFVGILVVIIFVGGCGKKSVSQKPNLSDQVSTTTNSITTPSQPVISPAQKAKNEQALKEFAEQVNKLAATDHDLDGLTDDEEKKISTNPLVSDSDSDGLTDRDEVVIYRTNPLNPDSDGDGFKDGYEVLNGYNPNGVGKLTSLQNTLVVSSTPDKGDVFSTHSPR